ncbi:BMP family protein [Acuticoccus kandeliae]|uniref:BMP family protein n=1 Tax=Acuticoccus kandeliae TaxID=2073160 RepID=UPI000D3E16EB|nr:BMP family protein [Acuticoccus kandeliae]
MAHPHQPSHRYRRIAGLALTAAVTLALAPAANAADEKAAMLLPGSYNDQSWNALGYSGLQKIGELGFEIAVSENVPDADDVASMQDYADQGYNVVLGHSGRFLSAAQRVGPQFPDVQFIVGGGAGGLSPNVMSIDYDNAQFGCQLGTLAAMMSKSGKIGGVYGLEGLPNIVAQAGGFRLCAKKAVPDITVTIVYMKNMEDAAAAKEAALSLIADGADVLTGKLNAAQNGVIEAAKEKGVFVTGRSLSSVANAPDAVLTNIIEKWDEMYGAAAKNTLEGTLSGEFVKYGYNTADATTGAALVYADGAPFSPAVPAEVADAVMALSKSFADGSLTITPTPEDARGGR